MKPASSKRRLRNVALTSKYHLRYMGLWAVVCTALILLLDAAVYLLYRELWRSFATADGLVTGATAGGGLPIIPALVCFTVVLLAGVYALVMFTAHRVAGPHLALQRVLNAVKDGDLGQRLKFRTYDQLDDVEAAFNSMMDRLQKRLESAEARAREVSSVTG